MPIDLEFHFQNWKHFLEYFGFYLLTTIYIKKNDARSFCLFVYFQSYNNKSKNFVFINCAVKKQHVLYANKEFLHKVLVLYFSSNIHLYIEKNPMEKLYKILEMKLKMYTPVSPSISFSRKSNLKFCIIFSMISFVNT